jgi:hypothetical protein
MASDVHPIPIVVLGVPVAGGNSGLQPIDLPDVRLPEPQLVGKVGDLVLETL